MSGLEEPYDSQVYHSVTLTFHAACAEFDNRNARPVVNTTIRDCFLKHGVEDQFSACLIHRHFDLSPSERNVELDGKARASNDLTSLHTSSWMFHKGKLYPYEFKRYACATPPIAFIEDYGRILEKHGLTDLLGFQVYTDGIIGLESTDKDAKVSTTVDQPESVPAPEGMTEASWAFFRPSSTAVQG